MLWSPLCRGESYRMICRGVPYPAMPDWDAPRLLPICIPIRLRPWRSCSSENSRLWPLVFLKHNYKYLNAAESVYLELIFPSFFCLFVLTSGIKSGIQFADKTENKLQGSMCSLSVLLFATLNTTENVQNVSKWWTSPVPSS